MPSPLKLLVFRDNSEWLRYVFFAGAAGMGLLVYTTLTGAERDTGKIIGGTLGVLLLGFSGWVLQVRRLVIDPHRLDITVISKGLTSAVVDRFRFDEVTKLLLLRTYESDEELLPANRQRERWSVLFVLKDRTVPLTTNLYLSKEHALREAKRIQPLLKVEISESLGEGLTHLIQTGRTINAAMALRRQQPDMSLTQAKEIVDHATSGHKPPL